MDITDYVTNANGTLYEYIEYFPFVETWVQEHSNTQRTPYLFTGKELDQETGLSDLTNTFFQVYLVIYLFELIAKE